MHSQTSEVSNLQFLKLGGSLITDKTRSHTARMDVITRLAEEIAQVYKKNPKLRLVLGHGSGSFGHMPAKKYGTRLGVSTGTEWRGFVEVWREAAALNHIVLGALSRAGLPAVAFPPSASVIASDGEVTVWDLEPMQAALKSNLLPVVYGDVVFDRVLGGTILSTEDLFGYLAPQLDPDCILLAGLEPGVWADYPICSRLIPEINIDNFGEVLPSLGGSAATDVTGGMASKVQQNFDLVKKVPGLEVQIFSGEEPGKLARALAGERVGTVLRT